MCLVLVWRWRWGVAKTPGNFLSMIMREGDIAEKAMQIKVSVNRDLVTVLIADCRVVSE